MNTTLASTSADFVTSAQRVMPGDILLSEDGQPTVLVTRARTRHTGKKVTQIEGEWLISRPLGASRIAKRVSLATAATYVRRGA